MVALKNFFKVFKKSIDTFKDSLKKSILTFDKEVLAPLKPQQEKSLFSFGKGKQKEPEKAIDSLGACFLHMKDQLDEMFNSIDQFGHNVQKDCVEALDVHEKNYVNNNKGLFKKAYEF